MGRSVRLYDYKEPTYGDKDYAWKGPNGKYYSSEKAYEDIQTNNSYLQKCKDKMLDLMGYKEGMIVPKRFFYKLGEWKNVGYDVIYDTMCGKEDDVYWASLNKRFKTEADKTAYICAIIENNLMDYYKKKQRIIKDSEKESNMEIENINIRTTTKRNNDVSSLLGDI